MLKLRNKKEIQHLGPNHQFVVFAKWLMLLIWSIQLKDMMTTIDGVCISIIGGFSGERVSYKRCYIF